MMDCPFCECEIVEQIGEDSNCEAYHCLCCEGYFEVCVDTPYDDLGVLDMRQPYSIDDDEVHDVTIKPGAEAVIERHSMRAAIFKNETS